MNGEIWEIQCEISAPFFFHLVTKACLAQSREICFYISGTDLVLQKQQHGVGAVAEGSGEVGGQLVV